MNDPRKIKPPTAPAPLRWGEAPALDAFETLMWRMDRYPNLRSAVTGVLLLDRAPDPTRTRDAHDWGARAVPRLRQRLVEVPLGRPEWVADERFSVDAHLEFVELSGDGSLRALFDHAAAYAMLPFDESRALWSARVVTGLDGGRAAYLLKLHHSLSDGIGIVQLMSFMLSRKREPSPERRQMVFPEHDDGPVPDRLALLRRQARRALAAAPGRLRSALGAARAQLAGEDGESTVSALARYAASLRRALAPYMAKPSPLLAARNHVWRFEAMDFPLAPFKAAAKACGATMNDALVAGLLGGFARYHRELGVAVDEIPMVIPISVRKAGAGAGGNHFAPGQLAGPLGDLSPRERMRSIGEQVARLRSEPALTAPLAIMPLLSYLPSDVVAKAMGPKLAANDLQCSNVPGIREDVYLAGARATHLYPFAPLPGVPAMIAMVTHGETCCVGFNLDGAAIAEPERFMRAMHESFDEILGLGAG